MKKEDVEFLIDLQQELITQDKVSQADPRFWVIMDYRWELATEGCEETYRVHDNEGNDWSLESFLNYLRDEEDYDELLEEIGITDETEAESDLIYDLVDNLDDFIMYGATNESYIVPDTLFLTIREAKEHLMRNNYNYTSKAHSYAMTGYRSPQFERLINILQTADFKSIMEMEDIRNE